MSKRDEFFLALGKAGATQRQAQNAFYAFDYARQRDIDPKITQATIDAYAAVDRLLSHHGLRLSDYDPNALPVEVQP